MNPFLKEEVGMRLAVEVVKYGYNSNTQQQEWKVPLAMKSKYLEPECGSRHPQLYSAVKVPVVETGWNSMLEPNCMGYEC